MNKKIACLITGAKLSPDERLLLLHVVKVMLRDRLPSVDFQITDNAGITNDVAVTTAFASTAIEDVSGIGFSITLVSPLSVRTVTCLVKPDLSDDDILNASWRHAFFAEPQRAAQN